MPRLPEVTADYIIGYWIDVGIVSNSGMGATILSSLEIQAWSSLVGLKLEPWEFQAIRKMSSGYCEYLRAGEDQSCQPPFGSVNDEFDRDVVSKKIGNAFKSFILAGKA